MKDCGRCGGEGGTWEEDDGRLQWEDCYHCSATGRISGETARLDALEHVAMWLSGETMSEAADSADGDDRDDWGLQAAESGCSPYAWLAARAEELGQRLFHGMLELPRETQDGLIAMHEEVHRQLVASRAKMPCSVCGGSGCDACIMDDLADCSAGGMAPH